MLITRSDYGVIHFPFYELSDNHLEVAMLSKLYNSLVWNRGLSRIEDSKKNLVYILCTREYLDSFAFGIPFTYESQKNTLKRLVEKGLIFLEMKGNPAKRHIALKQEVIDKIKLEEVEEINEETIGISHRLFGGGVNSHRLPYCRKKKIKKTSKKDSATLHPSASHTSEDSLLEEFPKLENKKTKSTSGKKKPTIFENWSIRLRKILRSRRPTVQVSRSPVKIWEKEFKLLYDDLESDDQRIDEFLDWYEKNISNFDKPLIASAKQFRARFNWLENIRSKMQQETQIDEMVW